MAQNISENDGFGKIFDGNASVECEPYEASRTSTIHRIYPQRGRAQPNAKTRRPVTRFLCNHSSGGSHMFCHRKHANLLFVRHEFESLAKYIHTESPPNQLRHSTMSILNENKKTIRPRQENQCFPIETKYFLGDHETQ